MRLLGKRPAYHLAHLVTFWYVLFYPSIRRRCRFYLQRRFPNHQGPLRRFLDTFRLVRTYGSSLVDGMVLDIFGPGAFNATCPDGERLLQLSTGDRGLVLILAHVGCWRVGMSTLDHLPKRVWVVRIPEPPAPGQSEARNAGAIDPRFGLDSVLQMTDALLRGDIVAISGDRTLGSEQSVISAQFLGKQALLPIVPYRLASATGSPVVIMTAPRIARDRYELRLAKVFEVPPGLGRIPQNYAPYAQLFADALEQFVHEHPWQFYNFYDFWQYPTGKTEPAIATSN